MLEQDCCVHPRRSENSFTNSQMKIFSVFRALLEFPALGGHQCFHNTNLCGPWGAKFCELTGSFTLPCRLFQGPAQLGLPPPILDQLLHDLFLDEARAPDQSELEEVAVLAVHQVIQQARHLVLQLSNKPSKSSSVLANKFWTHKHILNPIYRWIEWSHSLIDSQLFCLILQCREKMFGGEEQRRKMRKLFGKKLNDDVDRQPGPDRIPVPNLTRTFIQVPDLSAR